VIITPRRIAFPVRLRTSTPIEDKIIRLQDPFYTQTQKHLKPVDPMNIRTSSLLDHQNILIL
jgi:hypothetical protein